ncbi:hypothetical protein PROFUN_05039 [Planoprotostelium fungivorum]|uniref:Uncharacterized protein n=1 Tax=Planoprotostelium fungivorum TaxID=1890364 RepID=A0A2P6NS69_9EUKA|nr:hypothetical protein PROFUN_05039 [Planoprotostelium fungivorum]
MIEITDHMIFHKNEAKNSPVMKRNQPDPLTARKSGLNFLRRFSLVDSGSAPMSPRPSRFSFLHIGQDHSDVGNHVMSDICRQKNRSMS